MKKTALLALLALVVLAAVPALGKDVPFLSGHVNDTANLLSSDAKQRIEQKLTQYEQETGHQIAILTIDSLEGDPIEDFSLRVATTWKLGQKGKDDGALLLVSKGDRKMRIEVGYGLEANLTDLQTKIIQDEVIIPYFKQGDFASGIEKGADAIVDTLKGKEPQAAAPPKPAGREGGGRGWFGVIPFLLFLLFPFSGEALRRKSWFLYVFLMPWYFFLGFLLGGPLGWILLGAWAVLFPLLRTFLPAGALSGTGRKGGGGWWLGGGGFGGGGGSWSGGGGGGFSGGGGSFGGGGSSSSW